VFAVEERRRLSAQCAAVLARLECGPATNRDLALISLKYTSRISDLRQAGYNVQVIARNARTGLTTYQLKPATQPILQLLAGL
jgi:hypothetical protein